MPKRADKITEAELVVMQVLWSAGAPITSKELQAHLPDWNYKTLVSTLFHLSEKGIVKSEKVVRKHAHLYSAVLSERDYLQEVTAEFLQSTHRGNKLSVLSALFGEDISEEQYQLLTDMIRRKETE